MENKHTGDRKLAITGQSKNLDRTKTQAYRKTDKNWNDTEKENTELE